MLAANIVESMEKMENPKKEINLVGIYFMIS